ncbi:MAG: hypothetical protein K8R86_10055, partial [Bacteroidales bacterium]|nr:hypothetical protein [Bacteroidales bacterium]
ILLAKKIYGKYFCDRVKGQINKENKVYKLVIFDFAFFISYIYTHFIEDKLNIHQLKTRKMKKITLFIAVFCFGLLTNVLSQKATMELTFTAENNGQYVPLDSIFIENLTQGGDTMLYAPNTVLVLDYETNIGDSKALGVNTFSVSQNFPNPFKGETKVNLYLPEKEYIKVTVRDIVGRELAQYENTLNRGNHSFAFYSGNEKYYLFTVTGNQTSKTIKMLNANSNYNYGEKCKIVYNKYEDKIVGFKSQKAINNFVFNLGDELQYTGYANTIDGIFGSDVIVDAPQTNTNYEFSIIKGLRCPGTPSVTDIDGNDYNTVLIGSQCWMKENLKTTTYQHGTSIPNITYEIAWINLTTGAYVWYDNDISWKELYGALYNWYATFDYNGLCPIGWHVPTHDEWTALTDFIGGTAEPHGNELKSCRQVNSPLGGDCNTTEHPRWNEHSTHYGTDDYGFSGLPGGFRGDLSASFNAIGISGHWWSSTEYSSSQAWFYGLNYLNGNVTGVSDYMKMGKSVRCLRD